MQIFAVSALINGLAALIFSLFVIAYNPKEKVNRLYFLLGLAVTLWSFGYWRWQLADNAVSALFWVRILSIGSALIPVFYFHWITSVLGKDKEYGKLIIFYYIFTAVILLFSFSPLYITGVRQKIVFPFWPDAGIIYNFYFIFGYCALFVLSAVLLLKQYLSSRGERRAQIAYILIGSIVGFGGGIFNFFLWYNIPIMPYGNFLVALYAFFLAYAALKHRLFDIKIAATEGLIFLIWLFLLARVFVSISVLDLIINLATFAVIVFIGGLLAISLLKEARQKEKIEQLAGEIQKAYLVEKNANLELLRLDEAKTQFMVITQHHLRTPLTAVRWYLDSLLSSKKMPAQKREEVLQKIKTATEGEIKIVDDLLNVSQFQLGKEILDVRPEVDIKKMVEQIMADVEVEANQKAIKVTLSAEKDLPAISADESKLKVALANIIDNAVKYTEKGSVDINLQVQNKKLLLTVKDSGIGMTDTEKQNIFTKTFQRGQEALKLFATGKGIGLYISAEIIKDHNGKVWAESEGRGKGSRFLVELPMG